jgi:hypothetical protein
MLHAGIATVIAIMVSGLFEVNLGDTEVLTIFLVVVACGYLAVPTTRATPELNVLEHAAEQGRWFRGHPGNPETTGSHV